MGDIATIAQSFATYGVYTVIAVLVLAVVYLFKKVNELNKELQNILKENLKEQVELNARCTRALEDFSRTMETMQGILLSKGRGDGKSSK